MCTLAKKRKKKGQGEIKEEEEKICTMID